MTDLDPRIPEQRDLPSGRLEQRRAHLVREARGGGRRRRVSRRGLLLVPIGAVLVAGGAWATGLFSGKVKHPEAVQCYAAPSLQAKHTPAFTETPGVRFGELTPQELCAPFFERGYLAAAGSSPGLVACSGNRGVSVFPGSSPQVCRKLGLAYMRSDAFTTDIQRIAKAFRVAGTVVAEATGQHITYYDDGMSSMGSGDELRCLGPSRALRLVKASMRKAGLDKEFAVRLHRDVRHGDCITEASAPGLTDVHTIELKTEEISNRGLHTPTPAEDRAARERSRHICDHPLGRPGAKAPTDIEGVIDCALHRAKDGCLEPNSIKDLIQQALRREGLTGWDLKIVNRHHGTGRRFMGSWSNDPRVRQIVLVFGGPCPAVIR